MVCGIDNPDVAAAGSLLRTAMIARPLAERCRFWMSQVMAAMGHTRLRTQQLPGRLYWQDELSYWMPDSNQAHPTGNGEEPPL